MQGFLHPLFFARPRHPAGGAFLLFGPAASAGQPPREGKTGKIARPLAAGFCAAVWAAVAAFAAAGAARPFCALWFSHV